VISEMEDPEQMGYIHLDRTQKLLIISINAKI
jgi:hypothetical protein